MTHRYKITGPNGESVHGGTYTYPLPEGDTPGAWTPPVNTPIICERGYHTTSDPMRWPVVGMRVWETEHDGIVATRDDKAVHRSIRLTRERPEMVPEWWREVEAFVATIPNVPWFHPQGEPDLTWRVFDTRVAAWVAARVAAWDAAWDAAWVATRVAAGVAARDAAGDAAWDAARSAAGAAAGAAAKDAAGDATRDAALMARMLVCADLSIDQRHTDHVRARWDVWTRGYALLCDVDGVLYVYRRPA